MINLNDTQPSPVSGGNNVHFQSDSSGNVSAYFSLRKVNVSPVSGIVTVDASQTDSAWISVNAAITSMVITNPTDGQEMTVVWAQDSTGHAVSLGSGIILGSLVISATANLVTTARLTYNAADGNWYIVGQSGL